MRCSPPGLAASPGAAKGRDRAQRPRRGAGRRRRAREVIPRPIVHRGPTIVAGFHACFAGNPSRAEGRQGEAMRPSVARGMGRPAVHRRGLPVEVGIWTPADGADRGGAGCCARGDRIANRRQPREDHARGCSPDRTRKVAEHFQTVAWNGVDQVALAGRAGRTLTPEADARRALELGAEGHRACAPPSTCSSVSAKPLMRR